MLHAGGCCMLVGAACWWMLHAGGCCMLVDAACWWVLQQMPAELSASKFQLSAIAHSYS